MSLPSSSHLSIPKENSKTRSVSTAGISKIPNELLAEIFKLSTPKPITIFPGLESDDLPWALFGICKRWRHIVTGMPELWANIMIEYEDDPSIPVANSSDPKYVTRIGHETLLRSGNMPLSLQINSRRYNMEDQTPLINLVLLHSNRIRYLKLVLYEEALRKLLTLPPLNLEHLKFLSISCYDGLDESVSCSVFNNAPLQVAELQLYEWLPMPLGSPSTHLTYLSISLDFDLTPEKAHEILKLLPGLIFLRIPLSSDDPLEETDHTPLPIFPALKTLFVNSSQPELLLVFFKPLTLPGLTRLEIQPSEWAPQIENSDWDCSSVFSMVSSFRQLDTFTITLPIPDNYDMDSFLLSLPSIVKLGLQEISRPTLRLIYSGEVLPNLQTLQVPVTSETLPMHLAMMSNSPGRSFGVKAIIYASAWERYLEFDASEDERRLVEQLKNEGLLQLEHYHEPYARIERIVPCDLRPWD